MRFSQENKWVVLAQGLLAIALVVGFDYLGTWEFSLSLFYVLIIGVTSYQGGMSVGAVIALVSVVAWTGCDLMTGIPYTNALAPFWNIGIRSALFMLFVYLSTRLRYQEILEKLARTDGLTGLWNRRYFYERAGVELQRRRRYQHAFTMVYLDLDGFKEVNDTLGHQIGDDVLRSTAQTLQTNLRATDCVARFGGDEFAVLLSETDHVSAPRYLDRMGRQLRQAMQARGWSVTFSIGAITYASIPNSIDDMIRLADKMMYSVKQTGKNAIKHEVYN